jgi:hypothetical protein
MPLTEEARGMLERILADMEDGQYLKQMLEAVEEVDDPELRRVIKDENDARIETLRVALGKRPKCTCGGDDTGPKKENNSGLSHVPMCPVTNWLEEDT